LPSDHQVAVGTAESAKNAIEDGTFNRRVAPAHSSYEGNASASGGGSSIIGQDVDAKAANAFEALGRRTCDA
jgi:hypothetical protein